MKNTANKKWRTALFGVCYLLAITLLLSSCQSNPTAVTTAVTKEPILIKDKHFSTDMEKRIATHYPSAR
jgi:hypothetical protein